VTDRAQLNFRQITGRFAISRLPADASIPQWATASASFHSITRTADELSIVCAAENVPENLKPKFYWSCMKLEGPFSFSEVGILASFLDPLVAAAIPIFAVSTYDTDYVFVSQADESKAVEELQKAGHTLLGCSHP
jgi:uncharacterized protein